MSVGNIANEADKYVRTLNMEALPKLVSFALINVLALGNMLYSIVS